MSGRLYQMSDNFNAMSRGGNQMSAGRNILSCCRDTMSADTNTMYANPVPGGNFVPGSYYEMPDRRYGMSVYRNTMSGNTYRMSGYSDYLLGRRYLSDYSLSGLWNCHHDTRLRYCYDYTGLPDYEFSLCIRIIRLCFCERMSRNRSDMPNSNIKRRTDKY